MTINKCILVGRLGQDPEKKDLSSGKALTTISLATSEKWKDRNGEKQESTEWHRVVFWDAAAEWVAKLCKKGSLVYIEGKIETQKYEKSGEARYSTQIQARQWSLLSDGNQMQQGDSRPQAPNLPAVDFGEDTIPF